MIELEDWSIHPASEPKFDELIRGYRVVYMGEDHTIDDRVEWVGRKTGRTPNSVVNVSYDFDRACLQFSSGETHAIKTIGELPAISDRVLFDATSLLFPELLYLMYWSSLSGQQFDVIYAEPDEYHRQTHQSLIGAYSPDFSLSEDGPGMQMLPKFTYPLDSGHLVVALGYEGHRFGALLMSDEVNPAEMSGILGVPPFEAGWERNSYSKNHIQMEEARKKYDAKFFVTSANDPIQNYNLIAKIVKANSSSVRSNSRVHLMASGTKPAAIAMAWYAVNHSNIGLIYDFIKKKKRRTSGVGKVHLWRFSASLGGSA